MGCAARKKNYYAPKARVYTMRRFALEIIVFMTGAVVMTLEITASRLLAPYMGTSLPVWTSIIGVILASLAVGYWLGGRLADRRSDTHTLALLLLLPAGWILLIVLCNEPLLAALVGNFRISLITLSTIATVLLLAGPSVLLGMVSPYAVKLKLQTLANAGSVVGRLGALATVGSIVGTFLAGSVLLSLLGTRSVFLLLAATLVLLSLLCGSMRRTQLALTLVIFLATAGLAFASTENPRRIDIDTDYSRIWVLDDGVVRTLYIGGSTHSAMFVSRPDSLVYEYTKYYRLAKHFRPDLTRTLMIGGGAYSYPKIFLREFPKASMDVVEIDPMVTDIARKHFELKDDPRLTIFHEDGRVFLNRGGEQYDVIFGDAFGSYYSLPYQLTTLESVRRTYDLLTPNGLTIINTISSLEGRKSKFFRAEYHTLKKVFPHVYAFPVTTDDPRVVQNIMLVAAKGTDSLPLHSDNPEFDEMLQKNWQKPISDDLPILTDDFAPVDQYIGELL